MSPPTQALGMRDLNLAVWEGVSRPCHEDFGGAIAVGDIMPGPNLRRKKMKRVGGGQGTHKASPPSDTKRPNERCWHKTRPDQTPKIRRWPKLLVARQRVRVGPTPHYLKPNPSSIQDQYLKQEPSLLVMIAAMTTLNTTVRSTA